MKALLKVGRYLLAGYGAYVAGKKLIEWANSSEAESANDIDDKLKSVLEHDFVVMGKDEHATLAIKGACDAIIEKTGKLYISDVIKTGCNSKFTGILKNVTDGVQNADVMSLFSFENMNRYGWSKENWNPTLEVINDSNDIPRIAFNFGKITKLEDIGHGKQ